MTRERGKRSTIILSVVDLAPLPCIRSIAHDPSTPNSSEVGIASSIEFDEHQLVSWSTCTHATPIMRKKQFRNRFMFYPASCLAKCLPNLAMNLISIKRVFLLRQWSLYEVRINGVSHALGIGCRELVIPLSVYTSSVFNCCTVIIFFSISLPRVLSRALDLTVKVICW